MNGNDLTTRTQHERTGHLEYLEGLTMKELRHRQDQTRAQMVVAYNGVVTAKAVGHDAQMRRYLKAMKNLRVMEDDLMEAVDRKSFRKELSKRKLKR